MAGNPKTVLIVVDLTEESECAFEYYLDHVHQAEHRIILMQMLHNAKWPEDVITRPRSLSDPTEALYGHMLNDRQICWRCRRVNPEEAGVAIVEEARTEQVEMVAIGTRGVGGSKREAGAANKGYTRVFGSLAGYVIQHAPCPVIILNSSLSPSSDVHV